MSFFTVLVNEEEILLSSNRIMVNALSLSCPVVSPCHIRSKRALLNCNVQSSVCNYIWQVELFIELKSAKFFKWVNLHFAFDWTHLTGVSCFKLVFLFFKQDTNTAITGIPISKTCKFIHMYMNLRGPALHVANCDFKKHVWLTCLLYCSGYFTKQMSYYDTGVTSTLGTHPMRKTV